MRSERDAKASANRGRERGTNSVVAYACRFCARWHLGHNASAEREVGFIPGIGRIVIRRGYAD